MKKPLFSLAASIFAALLGTVSAQAVVADPPTSCPGIDANHTVFNFNTDFAASTPSESGIVRCSGTLPEGAALPRKALRFPGEEFGATCSTPLGSTPDWRMTVTPIGRVSFVCFAKGAAN